MIVLDTNVLSEFMRPQPEERVVAWLDSCPDRDLWTTSVVLGEIAAGIALLPLGSRRNGLADALDTMREMFADRILPFDAVAALEYGAVIARRSRMGRPIAIADAQIAATVIANGGALATRNVADFAGLDLETIDPWGTRRDR